MDPGLRNGVEEQLKSFKRITQLNNLSRRFPPAIQNLKSMDSDISGDSLRRYPIPVPMREKILWDGPEESKDFASQHGMSLYFEYYSNRARRFLLDGGRNVCIKTHSDIVRIAQKIFTESTREDLYQEICGQTTSEGLSSNTDAIENTINLCASLLLMTEIGQSQVRLSGHTPIHWERKSLRAALAKHFIPQKTLNIDNLKLGKLFTGRNLCQISGIKIIWSTNLADHLRLTDDDQAVFVFHCASFLKFQACLGKGPFPDGFINETLHTLALLFPSTDKRTKSWLQAQRKSNRSENIDPTLSSCGALRAHDRRFERFSFWRDRLVILKQAFDDSQPKTLSQWWLDRRNRVQWYTFWVAILVFVMTIVFGVIQSLEGALQVYLSYKSMGNGN